MARLNLTLSHEEIQELFSSGSSEALRRLLERTVGSKNVPAEVPERDDFSLRERIMADQSPKKTARQPSYIKESLKETLSGSKLKWRWVFAALFVYMGIRTSDLIRIEPYLPTWTPENDALVGVWHFDSFYSLASLDPEDFKRLRLELNSDQTFRIVGIPASMVGYTENKIDDAPGRSIKEYTGSPKKFWILSSRPIDGQTVIEGEWSVINDDLLHGKDGWIDLTAPGYNFEPWIIVECGLFSRGAPSESDFRYDGIMLCKESPPQR